MLAPEAQGLKSPMSTGPRLDPEHSGAKGASQAQPMRIAVLGVGQMGLVCAGILASSVRYMPYGMRYAYAGILQIHRELEDASSSSGAKQGSTFVRIVLPLLAGSLISAWLFIFLLSVQAVSLPLLLVCENNGWAEFTPTAAEYAGSLAGLAAAFRVEYAAGKGVVVALQAQEAHAAIDLMLPADAVAGGGARVVIEDYLEGEEASFIVVCDGADALALATSQDHKRIGDGDTGPNTGGMGAYSPAPVVTPNVHARVMHEIIHPTLAGMAAEGMPFTGFLYAGLMIDDKGQPRTVEFNCRLGDPEAQPILMRLKSDLFDVLMHATGGTLDQVELQWDRRTALGVVMAAAGYPAAPHKGDAISGAPAPAEDLKVFHAGTALADGRLLTSGGRVLCVTALADSVRAAQGRALQAVRGIRFAGAQWRSDIGHRALAER